MNGTKLLVAIALAAVLALLLLQLSPVSCVRNPHNGHRYCLTPEGLNWIQAQAFARLRGGYLVSISSQQEQEWLIQQFGGTRLLWIGFTDSVVEGIWRWSSGEAVSFTNWASGEPNDDQGNEDYAVMNWGSPGFWNDLGPESQEWDSKGIGIVEIP